MNYPATLTEHIKGDDGLAQDWRADTVFINPPFSGGGKINAFANKLMDAYRAGRVRRAVWLASNNTETQWFRLLAPASAQIFFPSIRIRFWRPADNSSGQEGGGGLMGDMVVYLGDDAPRFRWAFADIGGIFVQVMEP